MTLEDDLHRLLQERRAIDRALLDKHATDMAVLFTDIVGSTAYFEQRGDIEGLALVHRHNDLLFPVVKSHGGRIVKTIGDAIMAVFDEPLAATRAAVAMMRALAAGTAAEPIRIRAGVHFGRVLKDGDDVFGDTVNTAARVASAADADEVLVSVALLQTLPQDHGLATAPRPALSAKGKSAPVDVARVLWRGDGDDSDAAVRAADRALFVLQLQRVAGALRVAVGEGDAQGTVEGYAEVPLSDQALAATAEPFATLCHDGGTAAYAGALVERGRALFANLPPPVQRRLQETPRRNLRLHLDDALVHVPWELLHDGERFLGLRFATGRVVAARADENRPAPRAAGDGPVLVIDDPRRDLPAAAEEGRVVARLLESVLGQRVERVSGPVTRAAFIAHFARAAVLHVASHVQKDTATAPGGFVVADGIVTAADLAPALQDNAPALVFANGCHASTASGWGPSASLSQALLTAGVRHTLAPLWSVPDADALAFALRFYETALAGGSLGEATRRAREALSTTHRAPLSYAGYVLYGDPRATLPFSFAVLTGAGRTRSGDHAPVSTTPPAQPTRPELQPEPQRRAPPQAAPPQPTPLTTTSTPVQPPPSSGTPKVAAAVVGAALLAAAAVWVVMPAADAEPSPAPKVPPAAAVTTSNPAATPPAAPEKPATPAPREGPVRVSVMAFAGQGDPALSFLGEGLAEVIVTELAKSTEIRLIERGQVDVEIAELEFAQTKYVDPATRAAIGRIVGAEVVVLGSWQAAGDTLRLLARFVDTETGEVLASARADGDKKDVFAVQDKLAAAVQSTIAAVRARVRP